METSVQGKNVCVRYETRAAIRTSAAKKARIFSYREKRELLPDRHGSSNTGAHGWEEWDLPPAPMGYPASLQCISNVGIHRCENALIVIDEAGFRKEQLLDVPAFLIPACDCLKVPEPEY